MGRNAKSVKASRVDAEKRRQADFDRAIKQPAQTWSARMPAYTYTSLCPVPGLRRLPDAVLTARKAEEVKEFESSIL